MTIRYQTDPIKHQVKNMHTSKILWPLSALLLPTLLHIPQHATSKALQEDLYINNYSETNHVMDKFQRKRLSRLNKVPEALTQHIPDGRYKEIGKEMYSSTDEHPEPMECEVSGTVPDWVSGTFIRLGPGKFEWGDTKVTHLFDGDSIAQSFHIHAGAVRYSSKFLESNYHQKNMKYNKISSAGFGTWAPPDPCANIFKRFFLYFVPPNLNDNTNVNCINIDGQSWAVTETPWLLQINRTSLDVLESVDMRQIIGGLSRTWLAHPHHDRNGTIYNFSTRSGYSSSYDLVQVKRQDQSTSPTDAEIITSLPVHTSTPGYYHSFAMTTNYFAMFENPLYVRSITSILTMNFLRKSFLDILEWRPQDGTTIRLINRKTGREMRSVKVQEKFVFHHVNAFEQDSHMVMDVAAYADASIVQLMYMRVLKTGFEGYSFAPANLIRYRIPIKQLSDPSLEPYTLRLIDGVRDYEVIASNFEMPVVNYDHVNTRDYTYTYGIKTTGLLTSLVKVNVKTKTVTEWKPCDACAASEPNFIARPGSNIEDDGVIVSAVTGNLGHSSYLVVLDARTFKEIARATVPVKVATGIHGSFWPS